MPSKIAAAVSAPSEGWFALVFLAIALYCVVYAIIAANWVHHSSFLLWTPVIGLLIGFVIAKLPYVPQSLLHITACLFGFLLAVWVTSDLAFHVSWHDLLSGLRLAFTGRIASAGVSTSELVFFFYLTFLCFFLGYFGSWLVYRARLPWLVALVYCSIMLVNLNYVVYDLSYLVIVMLGALVLLIARLHLASQIFQWTSEGLYTDRVWMRTINFRCMQVASGITLLVLLMSWLLPSQPQPDSGKLFWNRVDNGWANIVNGRVSLQNIGALTSPYQPSTDFFSDQLTVTGSVHLLAGEVLYYQSSDAQSHYLEGFTYDRFDGHTWTSSVMPDSVQAYMANEPLPPDVGLRDNSEVTTKVTLSQSLNGTKNYVFGPAQPTKFDLETNVYHDTNANATSTTAWTTTQPLAKNTSYTVTSNLPIADAQSLSAVPLPSENQAYWAQSSDTSYLLVPRNLSPLVLKTAQAWTSNSKNAYEAMQSLERHLSDQNHFKYSVNNPPLPANQDAVDWLLSTHTGYCTHYATAMAIMARILHIPTRVAIGFSSGHLMLDRKVWSVVGSDAHSWVQGYFPNYGWINFDPTPGYALTTKAAQVAPPVVTRPTPPPAATAAAKAIRPVATKPAQIAHTAHVSSLVAQSSTDYSGLLLPSALGLLFAALIFFLVAILIRWWRNQYVNSSVVAGLFLRVCRIASWAGIGPKKWQTPYEYNRILSRRFPQKATLLTHLTELYVRDRWGSPTHAPQVHDEIVAEQIWPDLRALLLRSIVSKGQKPAK
jgi:transglutaminase-like putative cysteine protease